MRPADWPRAKGYAYGLEAEGRMVFISGIMGWDPRTHVFPEGFLLQARQALSNIVVLLHEANAAPTDIVRMTWYVADKREYLGVQKELGVCYRAIIGRHFQSMTAIEAGLMEDDARVEIEVTAVVARSA
jgi:enamine deaminase RidA (YjgF/YER057c/UK114 family)